MTRPVFGQPLPPPVMLLGDKRNAGGKPPKKPPTSISPAGGGAGNQPPRDYTVPEHYVQHNTESQEAHATAMGRLPERNDQILNHITKCGMNGATCDEVEIATGLIHQTASAHMVYLAKDGYIVRVPQPAGPDGKHPYLRRKTRREHYASVWVARSILPATQAMPLDADDGEDDE